MPREEGSINWPVWLPIILAFLTLLGTAGYNLYSWHGKFETKESQQALHAQLNIDIATMMSHLNVQLIDNKVEMYERRIREYEFKERAGTALQEYEKADLNSLKSAVVELSKERRELLDVRMPNGSPPSQ